jgi:hypothetical protein
MSTEDGDFRSIELYGTGSIRELSSIAFPYVDLETAAEVARALYSRTGLGSCDYDELAAEMGQTLSGAFRQKSGAARMFNLIDRDGRSSVKLTGLGQRILAPDTERAAKAESFLCIPLYAEIFERYKGHLLPSPRALEREMQSLGVSSKQTDKARQAFERSARHAGFFEAGEDRLVRPKIQTDAAGVSDLVAPISSAHLVSDSHADQSVAADAGKNHPLIQGLLMTLPDPGSEWGQENRDAWLRMAASIFDMIYSTSSKGSSGPLPNNKSAADQRSAARKFSIAARQIPWPESALSFASERRCAMWSMARTLL